MKKNKEEFTEAWHDDSRYVLMSNHFHFIVETPKGNLSEFMRHFNISYTAPFNRRRKFKGKFYEVFRL